MFCVLTAKIRKIPSRSGNGIKWRRGVYFSKLWNEKNSKWSERREEGKGCPKHFRGCVVGWFNLFLCDRAWEEELLTCHCAFLNEPVHKWGWVFFPLFLLFLFLLPLSKIKARLVLGREGYSYCVFLAYKFLSKLLADWSDSVRQVWGAGPEPAVAARRSSPGTFSALSLCLALPRPCPWKGTKPPFPECSQPGGLLRGCCLCLELLAFQHKSGEDLLAVHFC